MIELLLFILIIAEIAVSVFLICQMNRLKLKVSEINQQIDKVNIEQNSKKIKETVSQIKNGILFFIKAEETKEQAQNIKLIINTIIAAITFLRKKKNKT